MAGEVKLEEYTDIYADRWDRFVLKESINGTFLQTRKFLNYHPKDRFTDSSLVFLCGNNIVAVLPANYNLAERKILSHQGSTYGGLILSKNSCKIQTLDMIFNELDSYFKVKGVKKISVAQTGSIYQRQKTSLIDYYFFLNGYESLAEIGYYIDVSDPNKNLLEDFSASRRRDYRYSLKNSFQFRTLNSDKDIEGFYKILLDNYTKFDATPVHTLEELTDLYKNRIHEYIRFYGVFDGENMVAGAMIFLFDKKVFHTQYLAVRQNDIHRFINEFLYTNLINEAQEEGFEIISFGTATLEHGKVLNRNLAQYKEGYGTSTYINYRYEKEY